MIMDQFQNAPDILDFLGFVYRDQVVRLDGFPYRLKIIRTEYLPGGDGFRVEKFCPLPAVR
jgi:hypothetical protein